MSNKENDSFWEAKHEAEIENKTNDMIMEYDEPLVDRSYVSNCCGAPCYRETDICSDCKEHCGVMIECELCEEMFDEEEMSEKHNRCKDCYEEWGSSWPDRV